MEIFRLIKMELEIAREKRERERKIRTLERFFQTQEGQTRLAKVLKNWGIYEYREEGVRAVDNELKEFRLIIEIDNPTFIKAVSAKKPEAVYYKITSKTDLSDAGDLLVIADDKMAIKTGGIIFPQVNGIEGLFPELYELGYRSYRIEETEQALWSFQPWRKLTTGT